MHISNWFNLNYQHPGSLREFTTVIHITCPEGSSCRWNMLYVKRFVPWVKRWLSSMPDPKEMEKQSLQLEPRRNWGCNIFWMTIRRSNLPPISESRVTVKQLVTRCFCKKMDWFTCLRLLPFCSEKTRGVQWWQGVVYSRTLSRWSDNVEIKKVPARRVRLFLH